MNPNTLPFSDDNEEPILRNPMEERAKVEALAEDFGRTPRTNPLTGQPTSLSDVDPRPYMPATLPKGWHGRYGGRDALAWVLDSLGNPHHGLAVLASVGREADGRLWLHVSVSHPKRIPGWDDLQLVKGLFVGPGRFAYQVHPPEGEHYTLKGEGRRSRVLHPWAPLEGEPPLPDFLYARGGTL